MNVEKERPRFEREEPAPQRSLGLQRCPFCHVDLDPEREQWLICRGCLARHHPSCWLESGRCSSCGRTEYLDSTGAEPGTREPLPAWVAAVLIIVTLAIAGAVLPTLFRAKTSPVTAAAASSSAKFSWDELAIGSSVEIDVLVRAPVPSGRPIEIRTSYRETLLERQGDEVLLLRQDLSDGTPPRVVRADLVAGAQLHKVLETKVVTLKGAAGSLVCTYERGTGQDVQGRGGEVEVWRAPGLPYPVRVIFAGKELSFELHLSRVDRP